MFECTKEKVTLDDSNFPYTVLSDCKNIEKYGGAQYIWEWILEKKGHYILLERYRYFRDFNNAVEAMFLSNEFKYTHLLKTMDDYNVLDPYHIVEEHATGNKVSESTSTPSGKTISTDYETAFNDLDPKITGKTEGEYDNYKVTSSFKNDVSESFKNGDDNVTMDNLTSSEKKYVSRIGNIGNHAITDLIDKERKSVYFSLWDVIANDIVDLTCYKIFF